MEYALPLPLLQSLDELDGRSKAALAGARGEQGEQGLAVGSVRPGQSSRVFAKPISKETQGGKGYLRGWSAEGARNIQDEIEKMKKDLMILKRYWRKKST